MNIINQYLFAAYLVLLTAATLAQAPAKDLDYFVKSARLTSPLLKDIQNQKQSANIERSIIRSVNGVQATATGSGVYAPVIRGYGYDEVITNGQALEGILNLGYGLLNRKRLDNQLEGIKIQSDSLIYAENVSIHDLDRSIIEQYLIAYASQEQVDFNKEVVTLLEKEEVLLKQLTRSNVYKQAEYLAFLVTLQQQQLVAKQAALQLKNDYATLAVVSGISDTSVTRLDEPRLKSIPIFTSQSYFLKRFEIDSLRNDNIKQGIDLNYRPKLGIYANGGYSSSLIYQPYKNFGTSVGFTLSVPIYDGNQKRMHHQQLALSSNTLSNYKTFFTQQQSQQLNLIQQQRSQTDLLFEQINEQMRFAKALIDVDSKLLHTGDLRIADYIIAINNYMSVQSLFRQTTISRLKLINQYNYWNR